MENQENSKVLESRIYTEAAKDQLVEILKLRTSSLVSYSNRVWLMFNWFLTFNVGFFAFLFSKESEVFPRFFILLIGLLISILWFFIGLNDFISMKKHKEIKKNIEVEVAKTLNIQSLLFYPERKCFKYNQTKTLIIIPVFTSLFWLFFLVMKLV
jgi:hypothetical protein